MKKIILLVGFLLLWVFPPIAWDQNQNPGYGGAGAEYMRRQIQQQTIDQKDPVEKQQPKNKTEGLQQNQFGKPAAMKDREAKQKQKGDLETDKTQDKN